MKILFGGVAAKYNLYTLIGEPFKENGKLYILAKPPFSKQDPIKIRFYTDKAHGAAANTNNSTSSFCKIFGFKDEADSIQMIRESDLTKDEIENLFHFNWKNGSGWRFANLFNGGVWYAASDAQVPPITHPEKIFKCDWTTFKAQNKRRCVIAGAEKDCPWLKGED